MLKHIVERRPRLGALPLSPTKVILVILYPLSSPPSLYYIAINI